MISIQSSNINKKFKKNGFLLKQNFVDTNTKKKIFSIIKKNFSKNIPFLKKNNNLEHQLFHDQMLKLRKKKKIFSEIYDKINLSSELRSIFYQKKFLNFFSSVLKTDQIYLNGFMMRFDFPNDERNSLQWHQDSPYYMQTYPKFNAGVCWIPVTNNSKKNGTLQFIMKSNKKFIKSKLSLKNNLSTSQYIMPVTKKEEKNLSNLSQKFGDASFLHMNLKHRSGINDSTKVRITIACRFHCMKNFNIGKEIYFHNKKEIRDKDKYIIKKK